MSFAGNLADLGLGEILQIAAVGRKSGVLEFRHGGETGEIILDQGKVVGAAMSSWPHTVASCLAAANTPAAKDQALTAELEQIVLTLFTWPQGSFDFRLVDPAPLIAAATPQGKRFIVPQGLSTQFLALESARLKDDAIRVLSQASIPAVPPPTADEARNPYLRPGVILDLPGEGGGPPPEPAVSARPLTNARPELKSLGTLRAFPVAAIDDNPVLLRYIKDALEGAGYAVEAFAAVQPALHYIETLWRAKQRPFVVTDMILPRADGSAILGGLEILERIRGLTRDIPVVITTDYENPDAQRRAEALGLQGFLRKPRKRDISPSMISTACAKFLEGLLGTVRAVAPRYFEELPQPVSPAAIQGFGALPPGPGADQVFVLDDVGLGLGGAARAEPEAPGQAAPPALPGGGDHRSSALRDMLRELREPGAASQVSLLILRFATQIMNRAFLFVVSGGTAAGLGGVTSDASDPAAQAIKRIRVPLGQGSVFDTAIAANRPLRLRFVATPGNAALLDQLQCARPTECFVAPLHSGTHVAALLYGDNLPEQRPIGDTAALEIFLEHAGVVMEKALLEKRLRHMLRGPTGETSPGNDDFAV